MKVAQIGITPPSKSKRGLLRAIVTIMLVIGMFVALDWKRSMATSKNPRVNHRSEHRPSSLQGGSGRSGDDQNDTQSYSQFMKKLSAVTDPKRRAKMLDWMVMNYGDYLTDEVFAYLSKYEPAGDARLPLMRLACLDPRAHPDIFYRVFDDYAPGKSRDSLIKDGLTFFSPQEALSFLKRIDEQAYQDDPRHVATLIEISGCFKSSQYTEDVLRNMLGSLPEGSISRAVADSLAWRIQKDHPELAPTATDEIIGPREDHPVTEKVEELPDFAVPEPLPRDKLENERVWRMARNNAGSGLVGLLASAEEFTEEERRIYLRAIAKFSLEEDSVGTSRQIAMLPAGPDRDVFVLELMGFSIRNQEAAAAEKWLPLIQNETTRSRVSVELEKLK